MLETTTLLGALAALLFLLWVCRDSNDDDWHDPEGPHYVL